MARFTLPRDLYYGKDSLETLKTLKGKKAIIVVGGGSMKRFGFLEKVENYLYRITYDLLIHVINEKAKGMNVRDEDKKFLANFYKYAFVGLVLDWIKHDMKDDPNIIVADLSVAIHGSVSAALERYRNA